MTEGGRQDTCGARVIRVRINSADFDVCRPKVYCGKRSYGIRAKRGPILHVNLWIGRKSGVLVVPVDSNSEGCRAVSMILGCHSG